MALIVSAASAAPTLTTLATFTGTANGESSDARLISDASGNLYGTTAAGGSSNNGTVFKITAGSNALTTLASFNGPPTNGAAPNAGLIADSSGNLYGTTLQGGISNYGTVFEIMSGTNTLTTLASFNGTPGGAYPYAGVIIDAAGNLYGTTENGGTGGGTVFKIASGTNAITTLVSFAGITDGENPAADLIADRSGNLYGTTPGGGSGNDGIVFKISAGTNTLTTLGNFTGVANGKNPNAGVITDAAGDLYGTTYDGGASNDGTVFEIAAGTNTITTLFTFTGAANGANPHADLLADALGDLYGTTKSGGSSNDGTVFEIAAGTDTLTTLATFTGVANGEYPEAGLLADASGNLYGTTAKGGSSGDGTVFELSGTGFAVPEPGSLTLAVGGCVALLCRRRPRLTSPNLVMRCSSHSSTRSERNAAT